MKKSKVERIVKVAIYPAIGIARVGDSPDDYFLGPEVPNQNIMDPSDYRDKSGQIKRQAARFRIYGLNEQGEIIKELTNEEANIEWRVHVANKKSAWYKFDLAFDIPDAQTISSEKRNSKYVLEDRKKLVIDPGERMISGVNMNKNGGENAYAFDTGSFVGKSVYLGELRTDEAGRLIFLGGRGMSSPILDESLSDFANNENWHDDISDGSIDAKVTIDGITHEAQGAWVITAPPNFAPNVQSLVTGYDLLLETSISMNPSNAPSRPEFFTHILPIFKRMSDYQWVNAGFALEFGWGNFTDFSDPRIIEKLKDKSVRNLPTRQALFRRFRSQPYNYLQADSWPRIYGDAMTLNDLNSNDPREMMALLGTQHQWLKQWAEGNFDINEELSRIKKWEDLSPSEQALGLTRAALEETTGGPFHPGAEFTWNMRIPLMYEAPFRLKRRAFDQMEWGDLLAADEVLAKDGPLDGSCPGDITRWMAVPWQTDTASCLSSYKMYTGEYLPTFWPARVPNDVMTEEQYERMMDKSASIPERLGALNPRIRPRWLRDIVYNDKIPPATLEFEVAIKKFTEQWSKIGIVVQRDGPSEDLFPNTLWVETGRRIESDGRDR
ncbi:LodA/GoxA family CTQ-dependent oxidase [Paenibacillus polymyxa]|uniref:LodA/GoxA family CTQ-dependent oxidase n=1 Tax=Paenibacillus polymyxa TaxID=1406 RepID=UPI001BE56396|nr:LodA/GoxA family CTQ-dependent oxidase [Paenibacillus polymyxa]MBT2286073.1 LodA/GoxA family CTQ-dependent oxidase [Paenibacillus polymyxa]